MRQSHESVSIAAAHYAEAHAVHYRLHDLLAAVRSYAHLIDRHPHSTEADYSRSQVRNILNLVVAPEVVFDSQLALLLHHLQPPGHDPEPGEQP